MKTALSTLVRTFLVAVFITVGCHGETTRPVDFSHYKVILDREPFGSVLPVAGAPAQPDFAAKYLFCGMVSSNGEEGLLQAIIFNKETNHSFYRGEGETFDSTVKVIRLEQKPPKLVIQSGLEAGTLTYQDRPAGGPIMAPAPGAPGAAPPPGAPTPGIVRRIPFRRGN
jgi:hypothetical protein